MLVRVLALCWVAAAPAAPPLTTIQDVLYKADGTLFKGAAFIEWKSFEASDQSNIATHALSVPIVNGVLRVRLVPTTTGTAGAFYSVLYNSDGKNQFEEIWAVPPSGSPLRVRDVRVSTAPAVSPLTEPIEENDVIGLVADLELRPVKGPGYVSSRVAFINSSGALEGVVGELNDCVRVDGTAGPCGTAGGGGGPLFVDSETPAGVVDGSNAVFTLASAPDPATGLALYRNGLFQRAGFDYTLSGNAITFASGAEPQPGDTLAATYRLGGGGYAQPQVICSSTGAGTSATAQTALGTCTIAAGVLGEGDRVEIRFDYSHQGAATGFSFEVRWGATTLVARAASAGEGLISGRAEAGIRAGGAQWSAQSWGSALALAAATGTATDAFTSPLTIGLFGQMAGATAETVTLEHFTVVRYPAQSNP